MNRPANTARLVAAALSAVAALGEAGCTPPQRSADPHPTRSAQTSNAVHGAVFVGGAGAAAAKKNDASKNDDGGRGTTAEGEGEAHGGFGASGGEGTGG